MDLQKLVTLKSNNRGSRTSTKSLSERISLFEAVRRLTQDEGVSSLEIDDDGNLLSSADILKIAGTQSYRDLMLAYDDRR